MFIEVFNLACLLQEYAFTHSGATIVLATPTSITFHLVLNSVIMAYFRNNGTPSLFDQQILL